MVYYGIWLIFVNILGNTNIAGLMAVDICCDKLRCKKSFMDASTYDDA